MRKQLYTIGVLIVIILAASMGGKKVLNETKGGNSVTSEPTNQISDTRISTPETGSQTISLDILQPKDRSFANSQYITVKGKTAPNAEVFVNDKDLLADSSGTFSTIILLDDGENIINVLVNDKNGNYSEKEIIVSYEK